MHSAQCFISITPNFPAFSSKSPNEPPFHWMPLARLEKNRSRTPLLPEPTAMDMLYEQLKVKPGCRFLARRGHAVSKSTAEQNAFSGKCRVIERIDFSLLIIEHCLSSPVLLEQPWAELAPAAVVSKTNLKGPLYTRVAPLWILGLMLF